jgi:hypothetical protein
MSDDNAHIPFSDAPSSKKNGEYNPASDFEQSDKLNGYGESYTPEQLAALKEYLSFLADLAIQIYYEKHIED